MLLGSLLHRSAGAYAPCRPVPIIVRNGTSYEKRLYLEASAAQGNIYAQFFLDHLDSFRDPSAFLAATRLLHRLEELFREHREEAIRQSETRIQAETTNAEQQINMAASKAQIELKRELSKTQTDL